MDTSDYRTGDWIGKDETTGLMRKLNGAEIAEAEMLLRREAAENIRKRDAEHAARQNQNNNNGGSS